MSFKTQSFIRRQYMVKPDFELFHYKDKPTMDVEYHNHDFYEIYLFIKGIVTYVIEGKAYKLRPGDIILINNRELHKPIIEKGEPYERVVIWLNPDFLRSKGTKDTNLSLCFENTSRNKNNIIRPDSETLLYIKNIIFKLARVSDTNNYGDDVLRNIYLTELIIYLNKAYLNTCEKDIEFDITYDEKMGMIIRYINENLTSELTLEAISAKFYISKYHLSREFKKHTGYSIHQYILQKRLIMAKSMLKDNVPVTEVYLQCGFGDYSNFIRSFKKAFGLPPKKYARAGKR